MTEVVVLVPFGALHLALTPEQIVEATHRAQGVLPAASAGSVPASATSPEALVDADGLERLTGVDASWWSAAARRGEVPHFRIGRYVRFRPQEVLASDHFRSSSTYRHADQQSAAAPATRARKPKESAATPVLRQLRGPKRNGGLA